MLTKTEADATADNLLAQARRQSPTIQRRQEMPPWFLDAPDGLDPAGKRRLFDELQEQSRRVTSLRATILSLMSASIGMAALSQHLHWPWLVGSLVAAVVLTLGVRLTRGPLFQRMLRLHVRKNASL
jgi:hypothetical protein